MKRVLVNWLMMGAFTVYSFAVHAESCERQTANSVTILEQVENYSHDCSESAARKALSDSGYQGQYSDSRLILRAWNTLLTLCEASEAAFTEKVCQRIAIARQEAARPEKVQSGMATQNAWQRTSPLFLEGVVTDAGDRIAPYNLAPDIEAECALEQTSSGGGECPRVYRSAKTLMTYLEMAERIATDYSNPTLISAESELVDFDTRWDNFFFRSKPMLPLDVWATDLFYSLTADSDLNSYAEGFRSPPDWQIFFLHPAPAFEYVDDARDGEKLKQALYAEVLGVNRWRADSWLTGFSVIAAYADREEVDSVGWGGLFTFNNVYSIGVTKRGGDVGVFLSIDLANFYRDNIRGTWKRYRDQ